MSNLPIQKLGEPSAFARDRRFAALFGEVPPAPPVPEVDPVTEAYDRGLRDGAEQAAAEAAEAERQRDTARGALELAFSRLDSQTSTKLEERLKQTVIALCEASIAPLAIDPEGLAIRVERAVAMLSRAQDERVVLLNPEDLELVKSRLPDEMTVRAEAGVERGSLRIETADGGVEDGPASWRRILLEAFREC